MPSCPSDNTAAVDQSGFWSPDGINWDTHRIGWAIAGGCALLTVLISFVSVLQHARNYRVRAEQRQIIRILYMPPVYAVISFFSYRYFRAYTYYELAEVAYESITLSAFMLLLIEVVAASAVSHDVKGALERKEKRAIPFPFCFWRFRPTKPYFMYTIKWSVMQYVIIRPLISIIGIICQYYNVLCESGGYNVHFAEVYLEAVDFVSISVALYGLIIFYSLTKDELKGRRPLGKFLAIKLIVMATFYQGFVFDALEGRVIHATQYWTETNIADGLSALSICIEMVFFAVFMGFYAYPVSEYKNKNDDQPPKGSAWRALWDSINFSDFGVEIYSSVRFFVMYWMGKPGTSSKSRTGDTRPGFDQAFHIENGPSGYKPRSGSTIGLRNMNNGDGSGGEYSFHPRNSYDENIHLAPYNYPQRESPNSQDSSPTARNFSQAN